MQKRAVKIINGKRKSDSRRPLFKSSEILTFACSSTPWQSSLRPSVSSDTSHAVLLDYLNRHGFGPYTFQALGASPVYQMAICHLPWGTDPGGILLELKCHGIQVDVVRYLEDLDLPHPVGYCPTFLVCMPDAASIQWLQATRSRLHSSVKIKLYISLTPKCCKKCQCYGHVATNCPAHQFAAVVLCVCVWGGGGAFDSLALLSDPVTVLTCLNFGQPLPSDQLWVARTGKRLPWSTVLPAAAAPVLRIAPPMASEFPPLLQPSSHGSAPVRGPLSSAVPPYLPSCSAALSSPFLPFLWTFVLFYLPFYSNFSLTVRPPAAYFHTQMAAAKHVYGYLKVIKKDGKDGSCYPLMYSSIVGSGSNCDIRIHAPGVEDEHCSISPTELGRVTLLTTSGLANRKTMKLLTYTELDKAMLEWFNQKCATGMPVLGNWRWKAKLVSYIKHFPHAETAGCMLHALDSVGLVCVIWALCSSLCTSLFYLSRGGGGDLLPSNREIDRAACCCRSCLDRQGWAAVVGRYKIILAGGGQTATATAIVTGPVQFVTATRYWDHMLIDVIHVNVLNFYEMSVTVFEMCVRKLIFKLNSAIQRTGLHDTLRVTYLCVARLVQIYLILHTQCVVKVKNLSGSSLVKVNGTDIKNRLVPLTHCDVISVAHRSFRFEYAADSPFHFNKDIGEIKKLVANSGLNDSRMALSGLKTAAGNLHNAMREGYGDMLKPMAVMTTLDTGDAAGVMSTIRWLMVLLRASSHCWDSPAFAARDVARELPPQVRKSTLILVLGLCSLENDEQFERQCWGFL
ncbi:hypothetical protein PR048_030264 [Dryococelus australis]|uniref:CCHC-type domain-containing protein n=1 Tax=Dryococelus australis TaxID=614101 RepID=A0ABQ9G8I0_9NEOP|nr:hypothetical protein PR048_030264 [Dryococelus australis]